MFHLWISFCWSIFFNCTTFLPKTMKKFKHVCVRIEVNRTMLSVWTRNISPHQRRVNIKCGKLSLQYWKQFSIHFLTIILNERNTTEYISFYLKYLLSSFTPFKKHLEYVTMNRIWRSPIGDTWKKLMSTALSA